MATVATEVGGVILAVPVRIPPDGPASAALDARLYVLIPLVSVFVAMLLVELAKSWQLRIQVRRHGELARRHAAAANEAVAAERVRLARELHDIVAHTVSVMLLQAAGARAVVSRDPDLADRALANVEEVGQQAMSELRRLLVVLRSSEGDSTGEVGTPLGPEDLPELVRQREEAGLRVVLRVEGAPGTLAPSVGLAAYRVVQEGLTNAARHGGPDTWVDVRLRWHHGRDGLPALAVDVEDRPAVVPRLAGRPVIRAATTGAGLGLLGLRERVCAVGGSFTAGPIAAGGFSVRAVLPATALRPEPEDAALVGATVMSEAAHLALATPPVRRLA